MVAPASGSHIPHLPDGPSPDRTDRPVLVTGATGYVGGRLMPRLLDRGYRVRCIVRSAEKAQSRPWSDHPKVEIFEGDVSNEEELRRAMRGCWAGFYLIHSMKAGSSFAERDRRLARNFATSAEAEGLERIIYLGGLGETNEDLSHHLQSRQEVEKELESGSVPVTAFRAAIILGSGSASFEILRYLVERLPIMITPRWVRTECQPIAIRNVLLYLVSCLECDETIGRTLEIGGPSVLTYQELLQITAEELGLMRRFVIPIPVLTPKLSSYWIHIVTPISHRIARPLADGLRNRVVVHDDTAAKLMPQHLLSARESVRAAVRRLSQTEVETAWSDAGVILGDPDWAGGALMIDRRTEEVPEARPEDLFHAVVRVGGSRGYYAVDFLWRVRGIMDRLIGGPGLRRGRRHPDEIRYGDALDFWRVTGIEINRRLELRAEMKVPGVASLEFIIEPMQKGEASGPASGARITQTARFAPRGLLGLAYWYSVVPLHHFVFRGMLKGLCDVARERAALSNARDAASATRDEDPEKHGAPAPAGSA
ncbi:MAG: SDR family oxidoreductase [Planctomycetota bacterium]